MHRIIFTGHVLASSDAVAMRADAELAVKQCAEHDLSGMTLYCQGSFISVLEGDVSPLQAILAFYQVDPRMGEVEAILDIPAKHREFPDYRIGFLRESFVPDVEGAFAITGPSLKAALSSVSDGEAKTLLRTFGLVNGLVPPTALASGF